MIKIVIKTFKRRQIGQTPDAHHEGLNIPKLLLYNYWRCSGHWINIPEEFRIFFFAFCVNFKIYIFYLLGHLIFGYFYSIYGQWSCKLLLWELEGFDLFPSPSFMGEKFWFAHRPKLGPESPMLTLFFREIGTPH